MMWNVFGRPNTPAAQATTDLREALAEGRTLRDASNNANEREFGKAKSTKRISHTMLAVKDMLFPEATAAEDDGARPSGAQDDERVGDDVKGLVELAQTTDFLDTLAGHLDVMEFETRKDAVQVFNNLLRRALNSDKDGGDGGARLVGEYGAQMVAKLVAGYDDAEVALNCGAMLRECVRSEQMARVCVHSAVFWRFFDLVELSDFDVASDAFASFRDMLTRHVHIGAAFVESNMDQFVTAYNKLLRSSNYVTRRQSLKLLGDLLMKRKYFKVMTMYIASATNLRLIMNLLLDQRKNIQFEAFHVFKIFVANPNKTADVRQILLRNKDRLLSYLTDFLCDRNDAGFQEDRELILKEIRALA